MQAPPPDMPRRDPDPDGFQEMELVGIRVEQPSDEPIALLKKAQGDRWLPVSVGPVEAAAIAFAQQRMASLRPLTHDLLRDVLDAVNIRLVSARVISLVDNTFDGDLVLSNGRNVRSRPSDGIALAIRAGAPILASDEILAQAGTAAPDDSPAPLANDPATEKAEPARENKDRPSSIGYLSDLAIADPSPTAVMSELKLLGVRVEQPSNSPIVLLKEAHGDRYLPIWIGAAEATAIAFAQQGTATPAPLTHGLFGDVLEAVGVRLLSVRINALSGGIFYADLVLSNGSNVSARPSDAIAIAIRLGAKIETTVEVLDAAGVELPADESKDGRE